MNCALNIKETNIVTNATLKKIIGKETKNHNSNSISKKTKIFDINIKIKKEREIKEEKNKLTFWKEGIPYLTNSFLVVIIFKFCFWSSFKKIANCFLNAIEYTNKKIKKANCNTEKIAKIKIYKEVEFMIIILLNLWIKI
ncbi:hypothetical protein MGALLINA_01720 [Mycoplasmopsis gallinarum]|uniref:Uncharacterized protein n=1 Tax=Mycoplasmopsis gallinarum TaxID=29557 RepID=A0A168RML1_9BACT|nr:hypothetical protein MGALLINA_01720 [Mycoplasmopsis gallinarum]